MRPCDDAELTQQADQLLANGMPTLDAVDAVPEAVALQAGRLAWTMLKATYGDLTIVEEALLSPVIACRGVLRLPGGNQMGYTGSFINFVSDVNVVSQQLPRLPSELGIVVYRAAGAKGTTKLLEVRRAAVEAHLRFFCTFHYYFVNGIPNRDACGDGLDSHTVPPIRFEDCDQARLDALPERGEPSGLDVRMIDDDDHGDRAADMANEARKGDGGEGDKQDADNPSQTAASPPHVAVWSELLLQWLSGDGTLAALVNDTLHELQLDATRPEHADRILTAIHHVPTTEPLRDSISSLRLPSRCCSARTAIPFDCCIVLASQTSPYSSSGCLSSCTRPLMPTVSVSTGRAACTTSNAQREQIRSRSVRTNLRPRSLRAPPRIHCPRRCVHTSRSLSTGHVAT